MWLCCTDYREETNKEFDLTQWKLEIEDELEEMEEEATEIYNRKKTEYEDALKKHAEQVKAKVSLSFIQLSIGCVSKRTFYPLIGETLYHVNLFNFK